MYNTDKQIAEFVKQIEIALTADRSISPYNVLRQTVHRIAERDMWRNFSTEQWSRALRDFNRSFNEQTAKDIASKTQKVDSSANDKIS